MSEPLPGGVCFTLYNGVYPDRVVDKRIASLLERALPQIVMVHGGPRALMGTDPSYKDNKGAAVAIKRVRELLPNVRIWAGIGLTGITNQIAAGIYTETAQRTLSDLRKWCEGQGCESTCADSEEAGKLHPQAGEDTAKMFLAEFRRSSMVLTFTSYGVPVRVKANGFWQGGHAPFRFRPWMNADGVDAIIPQKYAAPKTGLAKPRALEFAINASNISHKKLETLGIARPGLPNYDYYQFHHTPAEQLVECGKRAHIVCAWASQNIDSEGETGLIELSKTRALW